MTYILKYAYNRIRKGKEINIMTTYRNTITGEIFTLEEIRESYEEFFWDMRTEYDSFEDWFEAMCRRGDFEEIEN